ncbi:hypothetical protein BALOs_2513 [Halobacteriovorax sp. BALOs_7]|nr:hypothetical protein BALOs_2513 [Halobacteriovorax sp. BALOs_7]
MLAKSLICQAFVNLFYFDIFKLYILKYEDYRTHLFCPLSNI